jgi:hypothetical protein
MAFIWSKTHVAEPYLCLSWGQSAILGPICYPEIMLVGLTFLSDFGSDNWRLDCL